MTITDPTTTATTTEDASGEPELCWLNLSDLQPHPDNPRASLGDLTELVRSIRSHGILEPLVVLPADDEGVYRIIAGHRRHAAGIKAGVSDVPAVVRHMSAVEVIEAMLSENVNRSDLTLADEVRAIERLMTLQDGLTPAKLCKRIGRSQGWVRARMAVTILPARWRTALDSGDLSLAAGEAAASVADLGPDHLDLVCERLSRSRWQEPSRVVTEYRDDLRRADAYAKAVDRARAKHATVFTADDPAPDKAKRVGELFDPDGCKAHASEPCHAAMVVRRTWGDGVETAEVCIDPRRHSPSRVGTAAGSDLATDRAPARGGGDGDDSHAKRKGRLARLAHASETWAKTRGGMSQTDLTRLALRGLVLEAARDAIVFAATILGDDKPREATTRDLLERADSPAALARVAGAVAAGLAESNMYWSASSPRCRDYLDLLTGSGWNPDDWTASVLARNTARDAFAVEFDATDPDVDDAGDGSDDDGEDAADDDDGEREWPDE